jgi:hypothetical protein
MSILLEKIGMPLEVKKVQEWIDKIESGKK